MSVITKAPPHVIELLDEVKTKHHPHLEQAQIALCFADTKPFVKGRFNWGKTSKFSDFARIWQGKKYDFWIQISVDVWYSVLNDEQREALLDLHLSRCAVEYEPLTEMVNGKKVKIKDEFGRLKFSEDMKYDDEGNPKWKVDPLDLEVFAQNVRRYGLWCEQFDALQEAVKEAQNE